MLFRYREMMANEALLQKQYRAVVEQRDELQQQLVNAQESIVYLQGLAQARFLASQSPGTAIALQHPPPLLLDLV